MTTRASRRRTGPQAAAIAAVLFWACSLTQAGEPRVLRVGTSGDYSPFSVRGVADGTAAAAYTGFDVETARRYAADRGYRLELVPFRWPELSRELQAGSFDVAMSGVTVRADRSVIGTFTVPVVLSHAVAVTWKGSGIDDTADLNRRSRRIAVNAGGYLEGVARRRFSLATIVPLPENGAVHMALLDRWTDAVVTDTFEEKAWTADAGEVVRIGPLSEDRKAYLVRADRPELAEDLSRWILARERDGTLQRLRGEKLGEGPHKTTADPLSALAATIIERTSLMPLVWAAKREQQKAIEDKAQEGRVIEAALEATAAEAKARGVAAPDASEVRRLFKDLIEAGKDVQERLADEDRQRRARREEEGAENGSDAAAPSSANIPLFDLETQIRPALGRLTKKMAMLLVMLDRPVTIEAVQSRLVEGLSEHKIPATRIELIATSVAALSKSNAEKR